MNFLRNITLGKTNPSRRQLLKTLGLTAAAYPLMPVLDGWAQESIRRLLLLFTSSGVVPEQWYPTGTETAWSFAAGSSTEPLNKHKADMIFFKGLARGAAGGGGHEASTGGVWTGNSCISSVAQAPSVDQVIAKVLPKKTDFHTYQFGVLCFYAGDGDITSKIKNNNPYVIHAGKAQKIASVCDPYKMFDQLFGGAAAAMPGSGTMPDPAANERLRMQKRSIIDALKGDFAELDTKVAREDKLKISAHLDSVREIERRLSSDGPRMVGAIPDKPQTGIALDRSANYPMLIPIVNKLVVAALASDRTRLASLQWSRGFSQIRHTWVGAKDAHHTLSHLTSEKVVLAKIQGWYAQRYAELFDMMKAVPEGGGTLFDNVLCAYSNELALGWTHGVNPGATWWATGAKGRAAGALKSTGRFFDGTGQWDYNQMLQTLCHAMGATSVTKVGDFGKPGVIAPLLA
jgi:hypothetical protein